MEQAVGDHCSHHGAVQNITMFIDWEHAIRVTVKSCSQIGTYFEHLLLQIPHIFRLDWAGRMVREAAIKLEVEGNQFTWQMLKYLWHYQPRHTITCVDHHFKGFDLVDIDK